MKTMNMFLLNGTREALRTELRRLDAIKPGCGNCTHYDLEKCKVYEQTPPPEWFKGPVECEAWEFDSIPF
jgi:hypothetical protein